jgi:hypothetical protein
MIGCSASKAEIFESALFNQVLLIGRSALSLYGSIVFVLLLIPKPILLLVPQLIPTFLFKKKVRFRCLACVVINNIGWNRVHIIA